MKQLLQDARSGTIMVAEVPAPKLLASCILVRTACSLVSAGTERASSDFARKNLLQKALARPDLVREVLSKINRDGLAATIAAVRTRLDQPSSLGYSSAGTVVAVGEGITDLQPGDRVACAGVGYATHAEFACVPHLLAARIPSRTITFDEAAFTTVGSVAIHSARVAEVRLGDIVAVIGLGLLGQLTVQILKAAGCCVLGMDISPERAALASGLGADAVCSSPSAFRDLCFQHSSGRGADAVLIAAQTSSNDPVNLAAEIARDRGVITALGDVGMEIPRRAFYGKELDFRVSRSCGPGRYDPVYEQKGIDYPVGYVRWTETRNMEAFLRLLADGKLQLHPLITHRFPIERAQSAYELITEGHAQPSLGVLITYPQTAHEIRRVELNPVVRRAASQKPIRIGFLGAGSFATSTLLPAIKRVGGVEMISVCCANGAHARHAAVNFGFGVCATDEREIFDNAQVNTVVIATRHHLHAGQVIAAIRSGKHVFCEKPLCLNAGELTEISEVRESRANRPLLMVGFNRRFAPLAICMKDFLRNVGEPLALHYRVNAGSLPADHWLNDPEQGGGRIIGEVCHFVDFLSFLTGAAPVEVQTSSLPNSGRYANDNVICSLRFSDGSRGTITYLANGDKAYSKERVEVFGGGAVAILEDFRRLELIQQGREHTFRSRWRQDKGHRGEWEAFVNAMQSGGEEPIPFAEIVRTMLATFAIDESRSLGRTVSVEPLSYLDRTQQADGIDRAS